MSASKRHRLTGGIVYSTNPNFTPEQPEVVEVPAHKQQLRVSIERKMRGGKEVTVVTGFQGTPAELKELCRQLQQKCGTGGAAKDGQVLIQGNHREKIVQLLLAMGYTGTKKSGG